MRSARCCASAKAWESKRQIGPGDDQLVVGIDTVERVKDELAGSRAALRHVVARMRMHRRRQAEVRIGGRQLLNQPVELRLGKARLVGLAVPHRDQRPQDTIGLRRPGHRPLVDIASPRRGMIAPGRKAEDEGEHGDLFLAVDDVGDGRFGEQPFVLHSLTRHSLDQLRQPLLLILQRLEIG